MAGAFMTRALFSCIVTATAALAVNSEMAVCATASDAGTQCPSHFDGDEMAALQRGIQKLRQTSVATEPSTGEPIPSLDDKKNSSLSEQQDCNSYWCQPWLPNQCCDGKYCQNLYIGTGWCLNQRDGYEMAALQSEVQKLRQTSVATEASTKPSSPPNPPTSLENTNSSSLSEQKACNSGWCQPFWPYQCCDGMSCQPLSIGTGLCVPEKHEQEDCNSGWCQPFWPYQCCDGMYCQALDINIGLCAKTRGR